MVSRKNPSFGSIPLIRLDQEHFNALDKVTTQPLWVKQGNSLTAVTPVNTKMGVRRPDHAIGMQFAHLYKASISQIHWQIPVLLNQAQYRGSLSSEVEINSQNSVA